MPHYPLAENFFLPILHGQGKGQRYCIFYPAHPKVQCRGALIYVHPFAEEMNKSRRMAAMQSRAFSEKGFCVLQMDLFACGDSSGEFAEARWEIWKSDLAFAHQWLAARTTAPISIWGLRLGALLALDYAQEAVGSIKGLLLWQPVINGEFYLTQFLRLRLANDMLRDSKENTNGTRAMRESLAQGKILDIAGYEISPDLANAIDSLDASKMYSNKMHLRWLELVDDLSRIMSPSRQRIVSAWQNAGVDVETHFLQSQPFWMTQEIAECPDLIAATTAIFSRVPS